MILDFIKKNTFVQSLAVNFFTSIHPSIMHNIAKVEIIKKAMWHCELEEIKGGYFEFGVYDGTSLFAAVKAHKKIKSKMDRNFYGFDSFDDGFKYFDSRDKHPFFKEGDFVSSLKKVSKRFSKFKNVKLIKGYFEESLSSEESLNIVKNDKCAIVFIDCDMLSPAKVSLDYVRNILQKGTIIIVDDYFAYKGDRSLGPSGALKEFLAENNDIKLREYADYGYGGKSFVIEQINF